MGQLPQICQLTGADKAINFLYELFRYSYLPIERSLTGRIGYDYDIWTIHRLSLWVLLQLESEIILRATVVKSLRIKLKNVVSG